MRRKMVAGNWKMFGSRAQAKSLVEGIKAELNTDASIDVVVFPSFVHLSDIENILKGSKIAWGGQNFYPGASGAFTGEVSAPMLKDYGCKYVLIGHSERRSLFHEGLELIATKFKSALEFGLLPVLCVGETLQQREKGETRKVIEEQLVSVINFAGIAAFEKAVIAYEPVWAIGTGLTATPEQAQEVHKFIREIMAKHDPALAERTMILYGGSVKADNAAGLFAMSDIDGGLVGGASLEVKSFLAICNASQNCAIEQQ